MVTTMDLIEDNKPLQKHWIKRVIAYLIDFILVSIPTYGIFWIFTFGLDPGIIFFPFPFMAGILQVFYSALFEFSKRQTIGKMVMNLEVEGLRGGMDMSEALIRNFSKVQGLLVLLDAIGGMATEGDPRQRYLDRIAETTVVGTSEPRGINEFLSSHERSPPPAPEDSQNVEAQQNHRQETYDDHDMISDDKWRED